MQYINLSHSYTNCSVYVDCMVGEREKENKREERIYCLFIFRKSAVTSIGSRVRQVTLGKLLHGSKPRVFVVRIK